MHAEAWERMRWSRVEVRALVLSVGAFVCAWVVSRFFTYFPALFFVGLVWACFLQSYRVWVKDVFVEDAFLGV